MTAEMMLPEDLQRSNEYRFSRKHINGYIAKVVLETPEYEAMVQDGAKRVNEWLKFWLAPFKDQCSSAKHHHNKSQRLAQLQTLDITQLVRDLITGSAYFQRSDTFVSASSMLANHLKFDDKVEAITTVAELCGVLCWTGAFTLHRENIEDTLMFTSNIKFPTELEETINRSMYMPPMVCKPTPVQSNFESPYLTFNDCRILGKQNGHTGNICLDVLNTQAQVALKLDTEFLSSVEEEPTFDLDTIDKARNWAQFKYDSYCTYSMIAKQNNEFYLDQKVDMRGRMYAQGYHITTQGSAFKKAMIELHEEELVEGVPANTFTVVAGKYEDWGNGPEENIKYSSKPFTTREEAEAHAQAYMDYPFCYIEESYV